MWVPDAAPLVGGLEAQRDGGAHQRGVHLVGGATAEHVQAALPEAA